jgi:hypothetical protein
MSRRSDIARRSEQQLFATDEPELGKRSPSVSIFNEDAQNFINPQNGGKRRGALKDAFTIGC